ncbi:MAG TPA: CTP synthase [Gemmatimonadales bacterium]|nr:CTP synthase [Gemmatimonadales bacterium]
MTVRIGLIGDHDPSVTAHRAIPRSLALAGAALDSDVIPEWFGTESLEGGAGTALATCDGIWCVPASPYRSESGALSGIRYAREDRRPFLGTCGGFQHALLEYARNAMQIGEAAHSETEPGALDPVITPLSCELVETSGAVKFVPGTRLEALYGAPEALETYHCRYGLSPAYERKLAGGPLRIIARDSAGEVRAVELIGHPFFVLTLYQPERSALEGRAHPLITAFVEAARESRGGRR